MSSVFVEDESLPFRILTMDICHFEPLMKKTEKHKFKILKLVPC